MEIFADTADLKEIRTWMDFGVIDGVTTNPSILLASGVYQLREGIVEIAKVLGDMPLSAEVVTDEPDEMYTQAIAMAGWASNIVVKIPVITTLGKPCFGVISALSKAHVRVNATACLSFNQTMLAAKAGATYVSIFGGRVADEGTDPAQVIRNTAQWLKMWNLPSKIIVGSIRETINIQDAALAGAHVVTIPPKFLYQMADHKYSRFTVAQFLADGLSAAERMRALEVGLGVDAGGAKKTPAPRAK